MLGFKDDNWAGSQLSAWLGAGSTDTCEFEGGTSSDTLTFSILVNFGGVPVKKNTLYKISLFAAIKIVWLFEFGVEQVNK